MEDKKLEQVTEMSSKALDRATGGTIVEEDPGKFWVIRQDGTVIAPAPSREKALEYARTLNVSTEILTKEGYEKRFGRPLVW